MENNSHGKHTFEVHMRPGSGGQFDVIADSVNILPDGNLEFRQEGEVVAVFAHGQWVAWERVSRSLAREEEGDE